MFQSRAMIVASRLFQFNSIRVHLKSGCKYILRNRIAGWVELQAHYADWLPVLHQIVRQGRLRG
jgi:hypothetical protein